MLTRITVIGACAAVALACASTPKGKDSLLPVVEDYNNNVRWERPERAAPYVVPEQALPFRDWSEQFAEDYDIQAWKVREIRYLSKITAEVEIERTGFKVRRLIEEDLRVVQRWELDENDDLWRLREGF